MKQGLNRLIKDDGKSVGSPKQKQPKIYKIQYRFVSEKAKRSYLEKKFFSWEKNDIELPFDQWRLTHWNNRYTTLQGAISALKSTINHEEQYSWNRLKPMSWSEAREFRIVNTETQEIYEYKTS